MPITADRHLLFGLLALQNGLINQGQLLAAFQAWTLEKRNSVADILVARGDLDAVQRNVLVALADQHLQKHGDVEKSLAAVPANRATRSSLAELGEPEIEATLARVARSKTGQATDAQDDDPDRTSSISVGLATSEGQRFRILRPHARGGLGAVFVALDGELHREVALKQILEKHADDPVSRQRFIAEAEITGGLEHPGVVPVYGLGADSFGRPYYAMRFIKGNSLKEAIEHFHGEPGRVSAGSRSRKTRGAHATPLALRKLLRRFLDVCNAVDYAHSRGVIHRDIKPANIIVGKYGETLVVDWGLAKAVGRAVPSTGEQTLAPSSSGSSETLPGSALGTPAYMSPEQARGELNRLGPPSDVYSLGATLCCMLTGKPPFEGDDIGVILRAVQDGHFPRPSQLNLSLDKALDAVCLKAMATRPEDRYPTARALADDLDRWMADEPVSAWPEPFSRRARRWARRNRTVVTAAAVALAAGVVGLAAVLAVQTRAKTDIARSLASETRANAELTRSQAAVQARYDLAVDAIKTFHTGVSEDFLLKQDQFKDVRDRLLKSASEFYGKLGALLGKESDLASRRALWQANYEAAELTGKVGKKEDALAAHRQVLAAREALAAETRADPLLKADVGRSLMAVAGLLETTGRTKDAEVTCRKAEVTLVDMGTRIAETATGLAVLADCRSRLGGLLQTTGRDEEALSVVRLARADQEVLAAGSRATAESRRDLAETICRVAGLLARAGKSSEAEGEFRKALAIRQKLADDNPALPEFRGNLADSHAGLGILLTHTGKPSEAEAENRKALAIRQKLADENPAVTDFRSSLAASHNNVGTTLASAGKSSEAEAEYRKALAIQQKLADDNPTVTQFREFLAIHHHNVGGKLSELGKPSEAEAEHRKALAIRQKLADDNPTVTQFRSELAEGQNSLGILLKNMGKPSEAEAEYRKALAIRQKLADDNPTVAQFRSELAGSLNNLGGLLTESGKPSEAEAEFRKALTIQQKLVDDNPSVTTFRLYLAIHHSGLGGVLSAKGKPSEAEPEYRQELVLLQKLADDNPAVPEFLNNLAICHDNLGKMLSVTGKLSDADAEYRKALAIQQKLVDANPNVPDYRAMLAYSHSRRGMARFGLGDRAGASAEIRRALVLYDGVPSLVGEHWFETACVHVVLASLAGRDGSLVPAAAASSEAETAMALLGKAVTMGYLNRHAYKTESALDPLRNRPDFQLLMMDLEMPAEPFAQ